MKFIKKIIVPILLIAVAGYFIVTTLNKNKAKMESEAAVGMIKTIVFPVTIVNPINFQVSETVQSNGTFLPAHSLKLLSDISGRVISHSIVNGRFVAKGTTVVQVSNESITLENEQNRIDKDLAQETLERAKEDLKSYEIMYAKNAITKQQLDDKIMNLKSAESKLKVLNKTSRSTSIKAPISGIINNSMLEIGSYLSPGTQLADIIDNSSLKVQVPILDKDVIDLKLGQSVKVIPDLFPESSIIGKIISIASVADASRNFMVEIAVPNKSQKLRAGMTCNAIFSDGEVREVMGIPINSLVGGVQDPRVYVVKDEIATIKQVSLGQLQGDKVEILSGLSESDMVVLSGQLSITDGSKVQIIK